MLVNEHVPALYRLANGIVGATDAPDVVQDTFTAAWRQLPNLRDPERFAPWLRRICVNRCRTHLRGMRRAPISLEAGGVEAMPGAGDFRDAVDARSAVGPAFRSLPIDQRAVLSLHYGLGLSITECATSMGVRVGTAKSRLNTALRSMRRALEAPAAGGAIVDETVVPR